MSTTAPLVVNIVDAGSVTACPANWGFIQGNTTSRYVLWNYPNATQLTLPSDGKTHWGTLYAPNAHLIDNSSGNIEGNLIAKQFTHGVGSNGGEFHVARRPKVA